ncbi:MAG: helix-turn-helix domain-containing protein [Candidatus Izimaplasma sp.]|nr:helix-turn-helix domain-containing protein [Candidatus Izimaplasma bacterium]
MNKTFGSSRKVYNLLLNEKISIYELYKDYPELLKSHKYLTPAFYKTVYPYLKENIIVNNHIHLTLQIIISDLKEIISKFQS